MKTIPCLVLLFVSLAVAGCGAKVPPVQPLPAATAVVEQDVRAFAVHALQIMDLAATVANDASRIEIDFRDRGLVPAGVQSRIDTGFRAFTAKMRVAKDAITSGAVRTWPDIKAQLDPVLADLQSIIDATKAAGPSVWQRVGKGLVTALQLLLAATAPVSA